MNTNNSADIQKLISQEMIQNYDAQRENIRQAAKNQIRKIQEKNKKYYDKRRKKSRQYKVGDLPQFMGPYRVTQVNRSDRYKVQKAAKFDGPNETRTSADFMKPWIEDEGTDDELETNTEQNGRMYDNDIRIYCNQT